MTESEAESKLLEAVFGQQVQTKFDEQRLKQIRESVEKILKTLTYREREIIKLRYGISDGYPQTQTLEEVGKIFKVTRERIRQVEAKAIRKLQHPVRARKLAEALGVPGQNTQTNP